MCECYFFDTVFDTVAERDRANVETRGLKFCQNFAPPALVLI